MKKVRKNMFLFIMIATSILVLAACNKNSSSEVETTDDNKKSTTEDEKKSTTEFVTTIPINTEATTEEVCMVDSNGKIVFPDEKVTKIQIRDGNTGEDYLITTEEEINKFIDELKAIKFSAIEADQTSGTSYMIALANDKNETLVGLIVQGPRTTFTYETKGTIYVHDKDLVKICEKYVK